MYAQTTTRGIWCVWYLWIAVTLCRSYEMTQHEQLGGGAEDDADDDINSAILRLRDSISWSCCLLPACKLSTVLWRRPLASDNTRMRSSRFCISVVVDLFSELGTYTAMVSSDDTAFCTDDADDNNNDAWLRFSTVDLTVAPIADKQINNERHMGTTQHHWFVFGLTRVHLLSTYFTTFFNCGWQFDQGLCAPCHKN